MFVKLLLLFTLIPLGELFLLIRLGAAIGPLPTILIVLITGLAGAYLTRRQGLNVWNRIKTQMNQGALPAEELIDGFLILLAGALLLTPGLVTDSIGFLTLLPYTRKLEKRWIRKKLSRMMQSGKIGMSGFLD